ncbi:MAG: GTPase [Spirochaetota bacterium]|nr:MAG: GTPase [Spirochaetota bacterium]
MRNVLIMGAAGRDFHNFNTAFRNRKDIRVVAFTATQIPDIEGRKYPKELAGQFYPDGIDIYPESELASLIDKFSVQDVYFSYSDVSSNYVMQKVSDVMKAGANFNLLGPCQTMLKSSKPVISVCATRTGCGKSQTTRRLSLILKDMGYRVAIVRHPMPYGDLTAQVVQSFKQLSDLKRYHCTIEEMEEYEPHIQNGMVVFAGVDYEAILVAAEKTSQVIIWDGGNNDLPFFKPDLEIVVVDPHRAGQEVDYYPGIVNFKRAQVIVINKIDTADFQNLVTLRANIKIHNPEAIVIDAASPIRVKDGNSIRGKRVLVIEDGPTLTHGEMKYGAGVVASRKYGAKELVDPRKYAVGTILETFKKYPQTGPLLPAMGYGEKQISDLEATIDRVECDIVVIASPVNLNNVINIKKPTVRVTYELEEIGPPTLEDVIKKQFEIKKER